MKKFIFLLISIVTTSLFSQVEGTLSGTITDQEVFNEGIVFAEVQLKGTELKSQTNFRGNFEIRDITPGNYTLEVRYLGYEILEIPVVINENEVTQIASSMAAKQLSFEDLSLLDTAKEDNNSTTPMPAETPKKP
ncbi:MAG: carboxypeptidase-like regulatory domain-containing protein [Flavobacteriaceae bacterium]|nr:carboxypeptidase-like regulatory domain-containing protein [Flavobacteriaceae bacterium]